MIDLLMKRFLLHVPDDDAEMALSATIFNYVCVGMIAFLAVAGVGSMFVFVRKAGGAISTLVMTLVLFAAISTARRGRVKAGSALLVLGLWAVLTVQVWLAGGLDSIFTSTYIAVIAIAGVLLGPTFAIIIAVATITVAFGMTSLQSYGYSLPNYYPMPPWSGWTVLLLPVFLIVATINGTLRAFIEIAERTREEMETRRTAEKAAKESEARYRSLFEHMGNAVAVYKPVNKGEDFIFLDFNKAAEQVENTAKEELLGRSVLEVFPGVRELGLFEVLQRVSRTGIPEHHPAGVYKDNRVEGWRENFVYKLPTGEVVAVYSDETDRKRAEQEVQKQVSMMETLLEAIPAPVFFKDINHRYLGCNEAFAHFIGRSRDDIIGKSVFEIAPKELAEIYRAQDEALFGNPITQIYETSVKSSDGALHDVVFHKAPFSDPSGAVAGLIGLILDITDRKKAEEALRESRQRLSLALAGADFGIWEWDLTTGKAVWDDRALSVLGYGSGEFETNLKNWKRAVHPDDWPGVAEDLNLHIEGKLPMFDVEYRMLNKTGDWQWVLARGNVIASDEEGKPTRMAGVFADITERKRTEEALRRSEAKYRFLTEHAGDLIWTLDLDLHTTFVTPSIEKVLGFTPEERMRQDVEDQLTRESLDSARRRLLEELNFEREHGIQEGKSILVDLDYYHRNGSIVCLQTAVTFIRDEEGIPIGLHGISRDVTELKRAEEALKESERRLSTLMANLPGMAYRCVNRPNWSMQFVSEGCSDLTGYSPEDLIDDKTIAYTDLIHRDDRKRVWDEVQEALAAGRHFELEYRIHTRSGDEKWVWERGLGVFPEGSQELRLEGFIVDVTERKRLQEQLRESQRLEAVGTLAGGIAHDFNNLLTIINGYTEITLLATAEDDPRYGDLQKVLETGRKGADLVERLLALSKKGESKLEPLDLNLIVEDAVTLVKRTFPKMIEVETMLEEDLAPINADPTQMHQVLMTLFVNADEAMPEGGLLKIQTQSILVDRGYCSLHPRATPGRYILIEVSDTGNGMSTETLDRIFDPFFTTKSRDFRKGTGLGLPVARGIVEQHGGWITCESRPGVGTTFKLYFPVIRDPDKVESAETLIRPSSVCERILLVDDEEYVRDLGKRILERAGYTVITASDGKEALEIYAREGSNIALVVLDLIMPHMGGEKCLEELLLLNPHVKVVVSSGHSLPIVEQQRLGRHVQGFVSKPYRLKDFWEVVRAALDAE